MPRDLDLAPFAPELAVRIDKEGATLDAHELAPIKGFLLDDVKLAAEFLVRIREQVERQLLLGLEFLVRGETVPRGAEDNGLLAPELRVQVPEVLAFLCAAWRCVLGVEVQHNVLAAQVFEADLPVAGCVAGEIGDDAVQGRSAQRSLLYIQVLTGSSIASRFNRSHSSRNSSRSCAICTEAGILTAICTANIGAPVCAAA